MTLTGTLDYVKALAQADGFDAVQTAAGWIDLDQFCAGELGKLAWTYDPFRPCFRLMDGRCPFVSVFPLSVTVV